MNDLSDCVGEGDPRVPAILDPWASRHEKRRMKPEFTRLMYKKVELEYRSHRVMSGVDHSLNTVQFVCCIWGLLCEGATLKIEAKKSP